MHVFAGGAIDVTSAAEVRLTAEASSHLAIEDAASLSVFNDGELSQSSQPCAELS